MFIASTALHFRYHKATDQIPFSIRGLWDLGSVYAPRVLCLICDKFYLDACLGFICSQGLIYRGLKNNALNGLTVRMDIVDNGPTVRLRDKKGILLAKLWYSSETVSAYGNPENVSVLMTASKALYVDDALIGVAGMEFTVDSFAKTLSKMGCGPQVSVHLTPF